MDVNNFSSHGSQGLRNILLGLVEWLRRSGPRAGLSAQWPADGTVTAPLQTEDAILKRLGQCESGTLQRSGTSGRCTLQLTRAERHGLPNGIGSALVSQSGIHWSRYLCRYLGRYVLFEGKSFRDSSTSPSIFPTFLMRNGHRICHQAYLAPFPLRCPGGVLKKPPRFTQYLSTTACV